MSFTARIRLDSLPSKEVPEGLIGHRFEVSGGVVNDPRGWTHDTTQLVDESAAQDYVQRLAKTNRVEFIMPGMSRYHEGFVVNRLTLWIDETGTVENAFFG